MWPWTAPLPGVGGLEPTEILARRVSPSQSYEPVIAMTAGTSPRAWDTSAIRIHVVVVDVDTNKAPTFAQGRAWEACLILLPPRLLQACKPAMGAGRVCACCIIGLVYALLN